MGNGWSLNHHSYLDVTYIEPEVIRDESDSVLSYTKSDVKCDHTYSLMVDENCSSMQFGCGSYPNKKSVQKVDYNAMRVGVTNCSKGVISGKTDWNNTVIHYEGSKRFYATTGAGASYHLTNISEIPPKKKSFG